MLLLLAGCASVSDKKDDLSTVAEAGKTVEPENTTEKETAISPEVLYLLMTAEIAGQRNQYGVALDGYLQAAKRAEDPRIAERAAKIGLFLKDTKKTDEAVSIWLKQDESNLTARKIATLSALKGADKSSAVQHLSLLLKEDPAGFEATLMELTKVLQKEGKVSFTYNVLEELSQQNQNEASVYFVQALLAGQMNRLDSAKAKVGRALEIQPEWDKALVLKAQLASQMGDLDTAIEVLEKVLEKTPDNDRVRKMLAQVLMKNELLEEAEKLYKQVLVNTPDDGESQFAIALIYMQKDKTDEALIYLKKLVNKRAWDAQACFYIGRIEFSKQNFDDALVWFDKVTQGTYVHDASMAAISVLINQKNFSEAEQRLEMMMVKFPAKQLNLLLLKAEVFNAQKKYQQAYDILSDALVQFPEHKDVLYTRALIAEKIGRLDELEADLRKILERYPDDVAALNALGYTLVDRTERYDEAELLLQRALELDPDAAVIIDSMGWLQFKKGNVSDAEVYLRKAYEKQAENEIAAHLAEVLWVTGRQEEATTIINEAIEQSPEDEYLLKFQQRFMLK